MGIRDAVFIGSLAVCLWTAVWFVVPWFTRSLVPWLRWLRNGPQWMDAVHREVALEAKEMREGFINDIAALRLGMEHDAKVYGALGRVATELQSQIIAHRDGIDRRIADIEQQLSAEREHGNQMHEQLADLRADVDGKPKPPVRPRGWRDTLHEINEAQSGVMPEGVRRG